VPEEKLSRATFVLASPGASCCRTISGAVSPILTRSGRVINGKFSLLETRTILECGMPTWSAASIADLINPGWVIMNVDFDNFNW